MSTAINDNNTGTREAVSESGRLGVVPPGGTGIGCRLSSPACDAVPGSGVYHRLHHPGSEGGTDAGAALPGVVAVRRTECRHGGIPPRSAAGRPGAAAPASSPDRAFPWRCTAAPWVRGAASRPPHPVECVERARVGLAALTLTAVSTALAVIVLIALAHLRAGSVVPSAPETAPTVTESYSEPAGDAQR